MLQMTRGSKQYRDTTVPTITNPTVPDVEQSGASSQHDDEDTEPTFASSRKKSAQRNTTPSTTFDCLTETERDA